MKTLTDGVQKANWIVVLLLGTSLTLLATWFAWRIEDVRVHDEIEDHLQIHLASIETALRANLAVIEGLGAFFDASREVGNIEFQTFTAPILRRHPTIQALEWAPRVANADRSIVERQARKSGLSDHGFTERNAEGQMVAAAVRSEYFPVLFIEPRTGNEAAVLYDIASTAVRADGLAKARDSGRMVATARLELVQETADQYGFLIAKPVYRGGSVPATTIERQQNLIGFVVGVFRASDIVEHAMAPLHERGSNNHMQAYLFDLSAPPGKQLIYPKDAPIVEQSEIDDRYRAGKTIDVAGREWLLAALPGTGFLQNGTWAMPWFVLAGGLLITVLLSSHMRKTQLHEDALARAHRDVTESEERFRAFMEALPEKLFIKNREGLYITVNRAFAKKCGKPPEQILGHYVDDFLPKDKAIQIAGKDNEIFTTGATQAYEFESLDGDGNSIVEKVVKFPVRNGEGDVVALGCIATDITNLKHAQLALQRSNRTLRTLSAGNRALVHAESEEALLKNVCKLIVERGDYPFVWVGLANDGPEAALITAAQFGTGGDGVTVVDLPERHPLDGDCLAAQATRKNQIVMVQDRLAEEDCPTCGDFADLYGFNSLLSLPLPGGTGSFGALSICTDEPGRFDGEELNLLEELAGDLAFGIQTLRAGERRRIAEAAMHKLQRAVEQSPHTVIITNPDGIIEYVNPKFTETTGYTAAEAIGENPRLVKSDETAPVDYENLWATITAGREWHGMFHNKRKDGTFYWADTAISPVRDDDGCITHFIGIQEDITKRIETEMRLRQSEKMESLGNLAGGIAHDFNNMLVPVLTLSRMVMRDIQGDDKQIKRLKTIVEAGERASELVKRILTFSRTAENEKRKTDLAEIVSHSVELLRATLPATIDLRTRIDTDVGAADVDQAQLQTIILNLASNAAHAFAGKTGQLEIILEHDPAPLTPIDGETRPCPDGHAKLLVRDNGPGIPEDILPRIFEPFFTTKGVGEGTGLGLAMVHGIVTEHGGTLSIDSKVGEGTSITVSFPLDTAELPVAAAI